MPKALPLASALLGWLLIALLPLVARSAAAAQPGWALPGQEVQVRAVPLRQRVSPGDHFPIAVILDHAPGFHTWPNQPVAPEGLEDIPLTATTITAGEPTPDAVAGSVRIGQVQWPEPHRIRTAALGEPLELLAYEGRTIAYVPVMLAADAPTGALTIPLTASYQTCNETMCFPPTSIDAPVAVEIVPIAERSADAADGNADPALFADFDPTAYARLAPADGDAANPGAAAGAREARHRFDFLGWDFSVRDSAYGLILGIAFIAGFLLNLTPCVLPVVPLKVLSLQHQARNPASLALLGTVYCLGIVATFAALGLLAFGVVTGGQKFDWGQIFTVWWFTLAMAVVVAVMGLGMFGLFTIRLPRVVYGLNPSHDSVHGNFGMGVLTALLSTPCTGPLLGATLAWVVTQPAWLGLATFVIMGAGMAFPYALLIAFPRLIDRLPRGGPGGELLKQVMGLLLLAVAAFLAGNLTPAKWPWYAIGAIAIIAWLWAIVGGWRVLRTTRAKAITTGLSLAAIALTVSVTAAMLRPGPIPWKVYANRPDDEIRRAIREGLDQGRVVVVDFTAKWCVNCHVIEAQVLNSESGRERLNRPDVLPLKVDLTVAADDQGWGIVREVSGAGGIPLIAIFRPDLDEPIYFQSFFKPSDLIAAVEGGGPPLAARP